MNKENETKTETAGKINEIKSLEDRIKDLINLGKEKGYITFEVLAEALKGLEIDNDSLDEIYNTLMENEIQVLADEEEAGEGDLSNVLEEEPILLDDAELTKDININDPVRMYLKEIGKISCQK